MLTTATIALREFLEAFLIAGVFWGISKKLKLGKEKEIGVAIFLGVILSLLLPIITFYFSNKAKLVLTHENAEILEGYLSLFSGAFLAYVVFSLHKFFARSRARHILSSHAKLENKQFDIVLFLTLIFVILREGFEIALFTATTSLFSTFLNNLVGLAIGFFAASFFGIATFLATFNFPLKKIYKLTEYLILILGASFVNRGVKELLESYFDLELSNILTIKLTFLPQKSSALGHFLYSFFSLERNLSLLSVVIVLLYILAVNWSFRRK